MEALPEIDPVAVCVCVGVLCTVGMVFNAVLIVSYLRRPVMRTSTNVYLVHKAAVDLVSLATFPAHLVEALVTERWDDGPALGLWPCKIVATLETLCLVVSANVLFGAAYDRFSAVSSSCGGGGLGDVSSDGVTRARNHVLAAWVYSIILVLPAVAAAEPVAWTAPAGDPAGSAPSRLSCGYRWSAGERYHSMYFGTLLVVLYLGHYVAYACFALVARRRLRRGCNKEAFRARHDTVQRCRAVAGVLAFTLVAHSLFWARHILAMRRSLPGDQTAMPHLPGGLGAPLSAVASVGVYLAAGANLPLYGLAMDQWRSVASDAVRCRWCSAVGAAGTGAGATVAVIDVTAAAVALTPPQPGGGRCLSDRDQATSPGRFLHRARCADDEEELRVEELDV